MRGRRGGRIANRVQHSKAKLWPELASGPLPCTVFCLPDGRYAVRGEMIASYRDLDTPEAVVIIDPEEVSGTIQAMENGQAKG